MGQLKRAAQRTVADVKYRLCDRRTRHPRRVVDDQRLDFVIDALELLASYAISSCEAAWRGDTSTLKIHLGQARDCLKAAIQTTNALGGEP